MIKKVLLLFILYLSATPYLQAREPISIELSESKQNPSAGIITFSVTNNTNSKVKILKWNTPFEKELSSNIFLVKAGNNIADYIGLVAKRGKPTQYSYMPLSAGETRTTEVNLPSYYNMEAGGDYDINYETPLILAKHGKVETGKQAISITYTNENTHPPLGLFENYAGCSQLQISKLKNALTKAKILAEDAVKAPSQPSQLNRYERWFGTLGKFKIEANFDTIHEALTTQNISFNCNCAAFRTVDTPVDTDVDEGIEENVTIINDRDVYAYVYPRTPYGIHICNDFWGLGLTGFNTQAGTVIHEVSHFKKVTSTVDEIDGIEIYDIDAAKALASSSSAKAITVAENHQFFAEDREDYFTITTTTESNETVRKDRPNGGKIKGPAILTSTQSSSALSKQLMHVDLKKGVISLIPIKEAAKNKWEGSGYHFEEKSCSYIQNRKSTQDDNPNPSLALLEGHDISLEEDNNNATIDIKVSNSSFTKVFSIPWKALQQSGSWSGQDSSNGEQPISAEDQAMQDMINNTEIAKTIFDMRVPLLDMFSKFSPESEKGADAVGFNDEQRCTIRKSEILFSEFMPIDIKRNLRTKVNIRLATEAEIKSFSLSNKSDGFSTHQARKKPVKKVSNYEKEPTSLFDALQNSAYEKLSKSEKAAWDKTVGSEQAKIDSEKASSEFDNTTLDDLEMFSE